MTQERTPEHQQAVEWFTMMLDVAANTNERCWRLRNALEAELELVKAERDAALKLVDDTLEAVGHQHDLGLTVCSCGKLMPPRSEVSR